MQLTTYKSSKKDISYNCTDIKKLRFSTYSFQPFLSFTFARKQKLRVTDIN